MQFFFPYVTQIAYYRRKNKKIIVKQKISGKCFPAVITVEKSITKNAIALLFFNIQ